MIRTTRHTPGIATAGIATAGIALVALGGLVACASAPRVEHPGLTVEPPTAWAAGTAPAAASAIDPDWWQELGEPALDELISEGLAHNHDLTLAAARVDLALAQARLAGAPALPQVAAGGDATRSRRNFIGFPAFGGAGAGGVASTTTTTYGASLSASWEVDLWGRLRADAAAAIADLQASQLDLAGARLSLTAQIVRSYTAAAEAGRQVDLAQATAANQRTAAAQIERRYERGVRSALDVRLSRATAAGAEAMVAARQRQHDGVVRQLELLLGRYPSAALAIGTAPPAVGAAVPVGLPAELIGRRPDLAAAERRLTAADLRVAAARRALLPRISLTASGGRSSEALGDLLDGDYSVWNLVGNLTVPLFQGGRLRAQVDAAAAGRDAELASYAYHVLRAFAEVEQALRAEQLLATQERALHEAATEAAAAEHLAADRYRRGLTNLITLLEAQRRSYDAQSQLLTIQRQRVDARVDLHAALGGGFTLTDGMMTDG